MNLDGEKVSIEELEPEEVCEECGFVLSECSLVKKIKDAVEFAKQNPNSIQSLKSMPIDYEVCGECGYDHEYESEFANQWHTKNPCSYCKYEDGKHEPNCCTR